MKKATILLAALLPACFLYQSCQNSVGKDNNENSYVKEKESNASFVLLSKTILSSPATRRMVMGLDDFYTHDLGRNFNGAMLVARKGVIIFEKYQGYSDFATKSPIDKNTTFQLASTSKPFTAMAILYLQQEGKLNIHDPLQKYFPKLDYPGVTIQDLLDHRSGLPNYLYFCGKYWKDNSELMTNKDVINIMEKYHPKAAFKPNTHYNYCNTNYALLGSIIEKVTDMRLGKYLEKVFFKPLGMKHTYIFNPNIGAIKPDQAITYDYRTRPIANVCFDGVVGDKNVYSTVDDLLKWDQALYDGELFTKTSLQEAYTPYSNEHPGIKNYGLGWHLLCYPDGEKVVYHNGWWHGNTSSFYRFIDDTTTLIILSNRFNKMVYHVQPVWKVLHEATFATDDNGEE